MNRTYLTEYSVKKHFLCRSGSFIVDRLNNFPEEPLPDPNILRQDFASCVLQGSPECQFVSGEGMGESQDGHRRQMSQFCGQVVVWRF